MSSSSSEDVPSRKSQRHRTPNKKYFSETFQSESGISGSSRTSTVEDCDISQLCLDSPNKEYIAKASELFDEMADVEGRDIYTFKTPKKRNAMSLMAAEATVSSPKTPKTPTGGKRGTAGGREVQVGKTPQHIRAKIKKRITKIVESSSDEWSGSNESSSDSESEDSETSSDEEDEPKTPKRRLTKKNAPLISAPITPSVSSKRRNLRMKTDTQYCLQSDEYFSKHSGKGKALTSDHTLDRLKTPRLPHAEMTKLLSALELPPEHETAIRDLQNDYKANFSKWLMILSQGFNILLYGLGSKRNLIAEFQEEMLQDQQVLVVNGFFPSLTIKDILNSIICDILELDSVPSSPHEAVQVIEREMDSEESHLFLLVHNLEGAMLRNSKAQTVLSQLAKIPNVHLIASMDHINTALLWDHSKLSNYNFTWWDVTSMLPYTEETAFENSLMIQNSGVLALSSLKSVFQSLTTNAKGIFMLIVRKQLENTKNSNYPGMLFRDLYSAGRESFLVSSDLALRAQLTELLDHKVVKMKQGIDGGEYLSIPIEGSLLMQFQQENSV
ncbi:Origin recognition complex subunit 2 [Sergentomyia squamirostris]